jgi:hypothetical protein
VTLDDSLTVCSKQKSPEPLDLLFPVQASVSPSDGVHSPTSSCLPGWGLKQDAQDTVGGRKPLSPLLLLLDLEGLRGRRQPDSQSRGKASLFLVSTLE